MMGKVDNALRATRISRRSALARGTAAAGAIMGSSLLAGCTTEPGADQTGSTGSQVALPRYQRFVGPKPELQGSNDGRVPDGYLRYPDNIVKAVDQAPADGSEITAMMINAVPPTPMDRNKYWQELNKRLGANFAFLGAGNEYNAKLQVTLAGGELPDIVQLRDEVPNLPDILERKFQDLTEYLSGDAIGEYPSLANLPTNSWRGAMYGGRIYGIRFPQHPGGTYLQTRADLLDKRGLSGDVSNFDELRELFQALTEPKRNTWASGHPDAVLYLVKEMTGAPNEWSEENGKFTSAYESEETRKAISAVATLWKDGAFHPDSYVGASRRLPWFAAGTTATLSSGSASWQSIAVQYSSTVAGLKLGAIAPPKFDGGGPAVQHLSRGYFTLTGLKKAPDDQIKKLLRVLNFFASPFGTEEYTFLNYGIEGTHYSFEGGEPIRSQKAESELRVPYYYAASPPPVIYVPGMSDVSTDVFNFTKQVCPDGVQPATVGLTSETDLKKGPALKKKLATVTDDIIQGRKDISVWEEAVNDWKKNGGDAIRREYEAEFALGK